MKKWIKEHKKLIILISSSIGISALVVIAWFVGKKTGEDQLVEELIHIYEYGTKDDWPLYESSDKKLGGLIYAIYAECIGD